MSMTDQLQVLRAALPGCEIAAFGDADARLILKADHGKGVPREVLDSYCAEAVDWFLATQQVGRTEVATCMVMTASDMRVYLRKQNRSDFLFLVCSLEANEDEAIAKGTALLRDVSAVQ